MLRLLRKNPYVLPAYGSEPCFRPLLMILQTEEQALKPKASEAEKIEKNNAAHAPTEPPRKKRMGPKGPNPLSVKRKKVPENNGRPGPRTGTSTAGEKRKRPESGEGADRPVHAGAGEHEDALEGAKTGHKRKRRRKVSTMEIGAQGTDLGEQAEEQE
jgi:U3 small nucleolar RNA-associated protein 23